MGEGFQRLYPELRAIAGYHLKRERPDHTLQATALVHEAYLRLACQSDAGCSRARLLSLATEMIRRILLDYARQHNAAKRGGGKERVKFNGIRIPELGDPPIDVIDLDAALRELSRLSPRQARVVELRYFGGLTVVEVAGVLDVSAGTVNGDWRIARAWLRARLCR